MRLYGKIFRSSRKTPHPCILVENMRGLTHIVCRLARYKYEIRSVTRRMATSLLLDRMYESNYRNFFTLHCFRLLHTLKDSGNGLHLYARGAHSNTGRDTSYPEFLHGLPQSLQTNSGMVLRFGNVHFLHNPSLLITYQPTTAASIPGYIQTAY